MRNKRGVLCAFALLLPLVSGCRPSTCWAPDGKKLALDANGYLFTFDRGTKQFQKHAGNPKLKAMNPVWSKDGQRILFYQAALKGQDVIGLSLSQLDVAAGTVTPVVAKVPITKPENNPGELQINPGGMDQLVQLFVMAGWSPDGKQLAYGGFSGNDTNIWVANADGSNSRPLLPAGKFGIYPSWSPDSQWVAYFGTPPVKPPMLADPAAAPPEPEGPDLELIASDGSGHKVLWESKKQGSLAGFGPPPRWSADGKSIIVAVDGEKKMGSPFADTCTLWSVPVDGSTPKQIAPVPGPSPFLTINEDLQAFTFFFAPKDQMEQHPTLGYAMAPFGSPKTLFKVDAAAMGIKAGQEKDMASFPIPDVSPDGKTIALSVVPQGAPANLLLASAETGQIERFRIPVPVAAPVKPAPKPPAKAPAKKPVKKRK